MFYLDKFTSTLHNFTIFKYFNANKTYFSHNSCKNVWCIYHMINIIRGKFKFLSFAVGEINFITMFEHKKKWEKTTTIEAISEYSSLRAVYYVSYLANAIRNLCRFDPAINNSNSSIYLKYINESFQHLELYRLGTTYMIWTSAENRKV